MRARVERGQTVVRTVLLVAAVALVGVLLYRQMARFTTDRVTVWVSAVDLRAGQTVTPGLMKPMEMAPPKGALVEGEGIQGRALKVAKAAGQPFYPADLEPRPAAPALATRIPVGRLLATVRVAALDLPTRELRESDRLDLIQATGNGVRMIVHDAFMMGTLQSGGASNRNNILGFDISPPAGRPASAAEALVLAIFPEDVFPLAQSEASGGKMKIVLHSDTEVKSGVLLNPEPPRPAPTGLPPVEIIAGRGKVTVNVADEPRKIVYAIPSRPQPTPRSEGTGSR